jgi:hypothetical protein
VDSRNILRPESALPLKTVDFFYRPARPFGDFAIAAR